MTNTRSATRQALLLQPAASSFEIQDILIAVAPIVGTARTMSAAAKLTEAQGIVIIALAAELDAEAQAG